MCLGAGWRWFHIANYQSNGGIYILGESSEIQFRLMASVIILLEGRWWRTRRMIRGNLMVLNAVILKSTTDFEIVCILSSLI